MSTNKDILNRLISDHKSRWHIEADQREADKEWLDKSFKIAIRILRELRLKSISQKELSERMEVSPQYINKVIKGRENLSLETISKFEDILGINLIKIPSFESSLEMDIDFAMTFGKVDRNKSNSIVKGKIPEVSFYNYPEEHSIYTKKTG